MNPDVSTTSPKSVVPDDRLLLMLPPDRLPHDIYAGDWLTEWSHDRAPTRGAYC